MPKVPHVSRVRNCAQVHILPETPAKMSKHWCFTINNPSEDEVDIHDARFSYIVIGEEIGEDGTPHLQGYVCMINRKRMKTMKKIFPRAHLEIKRGTVIEAITYCKKDGDFVEVGEIPLTCTEATKALWTKLIKFAKKSNFEAIEKYFPSQYWRNYTTMLKIASDHPNLMVRNTSLDNYWIHGSTGIGKSFYARERWPGSYDKMKNKWWDGYDSEETVIIDDIDPTHKNMAAHLKLWGDLYPYTCQVKGSTIHIRPRRIIVTSQYNIQDCYYGRYEDIDAITRRFKEIKLVDWKIRVLTTNEQIDAIEAANDADYDVEVAIDNEQVQLTEQYEDENDENSSPNTETTQSYSQ